MKVRIDSVPAKCLIAAIQVIRQATGMNLIDAKRAIDRRPSCVVEAEDGQGAERMIEDLKEIGASYEVLPAWRSKECTAESSFDRTKDDKREWFHPAAKSQGPQQDNYPCGDLVDYECPYCGLLFEIELPQ